MGELTALQIINRAAARLKLAQITDVTSTNPQIAQMLSFANEAGDDIARRKIKIGWPELTKEFIIEIGAPTELTASCTSGSATITVADSSTISAAGAAVWAVSGDNIQIGCRVASVTDGTTIVLTETVDATQTATLTFTQDSFDLPSDYLADVPQTSWDRRNQWMLLGPDTPQYDQRNRSGIVPTGPRRRMRQIGYPRRARIWPPPSASNDYPGTLVREYLSKNWAIDSIGDAKREFTANADTHVWDDDELLIDGIRWRYWEINGLPYQAVQARYFEKIDRAFVMSAGAPVLSTRGKRLPELISSANVQDSDFPSS